MQKCPFVAKTRFVLTPFTTGPWQTPPVISKLVQGMVVGTAPVGETLKLGESTYETRGL
jgi:hypothetical protein